MKKRFFAGVLACLMVVGLLPLSMWLKPVNAKAAADSGNTHVFESCKMTEHADKGTWVDSEKMEDDSVDEYFELYASKSTKTDRTTDKEWSDGYKIDDGVRLNFGGSADPKKTKNVIKFTTTESAKVTVWWVSGAKSRYISILDSKATELGKSEEATDANLTYKSEINLEAAGTYYLGNKGGGNNYICKVEVVEGNDSNNSSYEVTVKDENATKSSVTESCEEGTSFTLKAVKEENFLYWVNSYGKIVSRKAEYSFPVYYSDTYTAVYKSTETTYKFMTDYDQVYKTYTSSNLEIPTAPVKYGNEFDYWKIGETKVETVSDIIVAGIDTDVEIKPVYKEVTEEVEITINDVTKKYKKNVDVTADATKLENFMYWYVTGDESKILSYNDLYSFYADDKITSITAKCGTDTVKKSGIITPLTNYINGNNKTFVFEFTVPEGCTIEFAGIVASSTSSTPTLTDCEYIRGRSSKAETYRYSWTKTNSVGTTWNVRPILKYSDGQGNVTTIISDDVQSL